MKMQDILRKRERHIIRKKKGTKDTPGSVVFIIPKYSIKTKHTHHKKWSFFDIKM